MLWQFTPANIAATTLTDQLHHMRLLLSSYGASSDPSLWPIFYLSNLRSLNMSCWTINANHYNKLRCWILWQEGRPQSSWWSVYGWLAASITSIHPRCWKKRLEWAVPCVTITWCVVASLWLKTLKWILFYPKPAKLSPHSPWLIDPLHFWLILYSCFGFVISMTVIFNIHMIWLRDSATGQQDGHCSQLSPSSPQQWTWQCEGWMYNRPGSYVRVGLTSLLERQQWCCTGLRPDFDK